MNRLEINEQDLGNMLKKHIANRPAGMSPEEAAKGLIPSLSTNENAVLVAIATDSLVEKSKALHQDKGLHHG